MNELFPKQLHKLFIACCPKETRKVQRVQFVCQYAGVLFIFLKVLNYTFVLALFQICQGKAARYDRGFGLIHVLSLTGQGTLCSRARSTAEFLQVHMLRSKYQEALSIAQEAARLFKADGFMRNQARATGLFGLVSQQK